MRKYSFVLGLLSLVLIVSTLLSLRCGELTRSKEEEKIVNNQFEAQMAVDRVDSIIDNMKRMQREIDSIMAEGDFDPHNFDSSGNLLRRD